MKCPAYKWTFTLDKCMHFCNSDPYRDTECSHHPRKFPHGPCWLTPHPFRGNHSVTCLVILVQRYKVKSLSHVHLFVIPRTVAHQSPLSMEFSRQEYWNGLPFPSPEDLPNPVVEPGSPPLQADALPSKLPQITYNTGA